MISSQKEFLSHFGWDGFFESQILTMSSENLFIGRVINEERNLYRLQYGEDKTIWSAVTGKMQFEATGRNDYPAVGDWVLASIAPGSDKAVVRFILNRKSVLQRKKIGEASDVQILATNVDYVFITTSVNSDLNFGRLERYLTFAWDSGALPVILLTKADLCEDIESIITDVMERFPGVAVHALSQNDFQGTHFFTDYLMSGKTAVLVGSSGVGKSTLSNYLIGKKVITTQEVRADDEKGKHTTTARAMYESFYGGLIIDTPGMRELQFAAHEEGVSEHFSDIEALITQCRFTNCKHEGDIGCAILSAIDSGELLPAKWKSYGKIQREVRHALTRKDKVVMAENRRVWKKRAIENRNKFKGQQ